MAGTPPPAAPRDTSKRATPPPQTVELQLAPIDSRDEPRVMPTLGTFSAQRVPVPRLNASGAVPVASATVPTDTPSANDALTDESRAETVPSATSEQIEPEAAASEQTFETEADDDLPRRRPVRTFSRRSVKLLEQDVRLHARVLKLKKRSAFIEGEAEEEDDEGNVVAAEDDEDDVNMLTEADRAFIETEKVADERADEVASKFMYARCAFFGLKEGR